MPPKLLRPLTDYIPVVLGFARNIAKGSNNGNQSAKGLAFEGEVSGQRVGACAPSDLHRLEFRESGRRSSRRYSECPAGLRVDHRSPAGTSHWLLRAPKAVDPSGSLAKGQPCSRLRQNTDGCRHVWPSAVGLPLQPPQVGGGYSKAAVVEEPGDIFNRLASIAAEFGGTVAEDMNAGRW
jgi:hypothetical protein